MGIKEHLVAFHRPYIAFLYVVVSTIFIAPLSAKVLRYLVNKMPGLYSHQSNAQHPVVFLMGVIPLIVFFILIFTYGMFILQGGRYIPDVAETKIFCRYYYSKVVKDTESSDRIEKFLEQRKIKEANSDGR